MKIIVSGKEGQYLTKWLIELYMPWANDVRVAELAGSASHMTMSSLL